MSLAAVLAEIEQHEREHAAVLAEIRSRLDQLEGRHATYTIKQFAELCHCSDDTVRRAIDDDLIRAVHLGGRTTVIPASELEGRWASDREPSAPTVLGVAS